LPESSVKLSAPVTQPVNVCEELEVIEDCSEVVLLWDDWSVVAAG